jgi:hypothetical protein
MSRVSLTEFQHLVFIGTEISSQYTNEREEIHEEKNGCWDRRKGRWKMKEPRNEIEKGRGDEAKKDG